ncbi:MAG: hypothetical protein LC794_04705 [Acidobacteria bacterium]|nr:hypothetical protein [Acidobacteriota bacterium]
MQRRLTPLMLPEAADKIRAQSLLPVRSQTEIDRSLNKDEEVHRTVNDIVFG